MGEAKKQLTLDAEKLIIKEKADVPDQYHSSELQAFEALRRRGVAMAFADMLTWDSHERYLQQLTGHLRMDPPQNYMRPTLQQILKADRSNPCWSTRESQVRPAERQRAPIFFPSDTFVASARSFNMFKSLLQLGLID